MDEQLSPGQIVSLMNPDGYETPETWDQEVVPEGWRSELGPRPVEIKAEQCDREREL